MSRLNLEDPIIERPNFKGAMKMGVTNLIGTGNTTLDVDMGPVLTITPTASRTLTLPAATAALRGTTFIIVNAAAFTVVVQNPTPTTVATIPATVGAMGIFVCLGDSATAGGVGGWSGGL